MFELNDKLEKLQAENIDVLRDLESAVQRGRELLEQGHDR